MTNIQYIDCMIEKCSVYFGQFLVVKTEGVTASWAGSVKQIKKIRQAATELLVKTTIISTWEINLTFYHRAVKDDISSLESLFRNIRFENNFAKFEV